MCGISALLSPRPIEIGTLLAMNALIRHRGPDDEGYVLFGEDAAICLAGNDTAEGAMQAPVPWSPRRHALAEMREEANLAFGHRRLSIVDVSPLGHQPMSYADGRYWITYNGEVYNHLELRAELEAAGYGFISHSDTEVILAAYDFWGEGCLSRFNGMWAFAIYDTKARSIFLARDRFGVKPLYYWVAPDGALCFGSEIKQFTAYPGWEARANGQRAYDFLVWGLTDHTDETMFESVYQLRPGCSATLDMQIWQSQMMQGRLPVKQWYTLSAQPFTGSSEDAAEQFKDKFTASVQLRLRADVPVGSCLSGGLDSSSIVCVANRLLREQDAHSLQRTFSACADVKRFDEREFIDDVVRDTGVEGHYVYPDLANLFSTCEAITWHQDEPFGSTSIYAQWEVFKLAAQNGVKVMLDGQGADEQLAGYHPYFGIRLARLFRAGSWQELCREAGAIRKVHGYSTRWVMQQMLNNLLPEAVRQPLRKLVGKPTTVTPDWLNMKALGAEAGDPFKKSSAKINSVAELSYSQLTSSNLQMLLHWEDRDSMAHSIESRVPFLDYRLVEFVLGLPEESKISGGITKRVLRDGMKGILPETIRGRMDKLGFVTPEEVWLKERSPDQFRKALKEAVASSGELLNENANLLLEKMISGDAPFNFLIWRLISFGVWMRVFSVK